MLSKRNIKLDFGKFVSKGLTYDKLLCFYNVIILNKYVTDKVTGNIIKISLSNYNSILFDFQNFYSIFNNKILDVWYFSFYNLLLKKDYFLITHFNILVNLSVIFKVIFFIYFYIFFLFVNMFYSLFSCLRLK